MSQYWFSPFAVTSLIAVIGRLPAALPVVCSLIDLRCSSLVASPCWQFC
ncbi:MAG: hypothetical protein IJU01_07175 [Lachnospiraceae bacterium]|nr:hypothetical protein [Lachnospiraceae bacterium]